MIGFLKSLARRRPVPNKARADEARDFLHGSLGAMAPVQPPTAANDDPLRPIFAEVERELRVSGYLR